MPLRIICQMAYLLRVYIEILRQLDIDRMKYNGSHFILDRRATICSNSVVHEMCSISGMELFAK